jgi:HK97 family phage prohead protease
MDTAAPQVERRTVEHVEFRLAPAEVDGIRHMVGHAAVFNSLSQDLGGFFEEIRSGAFTDAIESDDVRALFNHDPNYVLGRNTSGSLTLAEDARGLSIDIIPPDTQWARDLAVSIERGDINQMSFSFQTIDDSWVNDARGTVRTLNKVRLLDVSPVTYPAYLAADIAMRTAADTTKASSTPPEVDQEIPPVENDAPAQEGRLRKLRIRLALTAAD